MLRERVRTTPPFQEYLIGLQETQYMEQRIRLATANGRRQYTILRNKGVAVYWDR